MSESKTESISLVASFDFDGCSDTENSREELINHIVQSSKRIQGLNQIIIMIGSLRQSLFLDIMNAKNNSCLPHFISCSILVKHIQQRLSELIDESIEITFDPYLQFDSFQQLRPGTTYQFMLKVFNEVDHLHIHHFHTAHSYSILESLSYDSESTINLLSANHLADCSKISLLYSQMHHIASKYPHQQFIMHFYDDKHEILTHLHRFYYQNPQWIPENLTLYLYMQLSHETFTPVSILSPLLGTGFINKDYHVQLKVMAESLNWKSIPIGYTQLETEFQTFFPSQETSKKFVNIAPQQTPPTILPQSPYLDTITFPPFFSSEEEKSIFLNNSIKQCEQILNSLLCKEQQLFNEFTNQLSEYNDFPMAYKLTYELSKLKTQPLNSLTWNKIYEIELELETNYSDDSYRVTLQEAQEYADMHLTYDLRIENQISYFEKCIQKLKMKINETPVTSSLIIRPKATRSSQVRILFTPQPDVSNDEWMTPTSNPK